MNRRTFLAASGGLALGCRGAERTSLTGAPPPVDTAATTPPDGVTLADTGPALPNRVPRSLLTSDDAELDVRLELISGALPRDWSGHGFLVHPVPFKDGTPVFQGDGKVVRLDFGEDGVDLKSRVMRTPDHYADAATLGQSDGFENNGLARMSLPLGFRNFPNTALVPFADRLLVTSDAGRPWEIDPSTLELATPVGWTSEWRSILPGFVTLFVDWPFQLHMSTAHPAVDHETRELFSVNYGIPLIGDATFTDLVRWDGLGALQRWEVVDAADGSAIVLGQSAHQIGLSRDHVVLADTSFLVEISLSGLPEAEAQSPDTVLYVIRRADLDPAAPSVPARRVVLPRESVHFLVDFDDADGIVIHVAHNCGADASEWVRADDTLPDGTPVDPELVGLVCASTDLGAWGRYVLDRETGAVLTASVTYDERLWGGPALVAARGPELAERWGSLFWANFGLPAELRVQRIEALYADHPYREVPLAELPDAPSSLVRVDAAAGEVVEQYVLPAGRALLSPIFVPRAGSVADDDGYIVAAVISDAGDELWVFDAAHLAWGPLARLGHPDLNLPFTLHTCWVPSVAPRTATYRVDVRADLEPAVAKLSPELQALFEDEVFPHFA